MKDHPQHWQSFVDAMAANNVQVPPFSQINLGVIRPNDYDILISIVKDTTIKQAVINDDFLNYVANYLRENREIGDLGKSRLQETGFVLGDDLNDSEIWNSLVKVAEGLIKDFLPTAISIVSSSVTNGILGKRDLSSTIQQNLDKLQVIIIEILC
jgi:hypothetical protein